MNKTDTFYSVEGWDREEYFDSFKDCVNEYLDECASHQHGGGEVPHGFPLESPREITVVEHKRARIMSLPSTLEDSIQEQVLDALFEHEYSPLEDEFTQNVEMVEKLTKEFLAGICAKYICWHCEPNGITHRVNVEKWNKGNGIDGMVSTKSGKTLTK